MRGFVDVWWTADVVDRRAVLVDVLTPYLVGARRASPGSDDRVSRATQASPLQEYSATSPAFDFVLGPHGKPRLTVDIGVHFNVSHAAGVTVIAVSDGEVGVDIESSARPPHFVEGLWTFLPPGERDGDVLSAWTRREALLKAIGIGVCRDPAGVAADRWRIIELELPAGYVGHVAVREREVDVGIFGV